MRSYSFPHLPWRAWRNHIKEICLYYWQHKIEADFGWIVFLLAVCLWIWSLCTLNSFHAYCSLRRINYWSSFHVQQTTQLRNDRDDLALPLRLGYFSKTVQNLSSQECVSGTYASRPMRLSQCWWVFGASYPLYETRGQVFYLIS